MMHKVLARQLRRLGLDSETPPDPDTWRALLATLAQTYEDADKTRYRLERALSISSDESRRHADRQTALVRCAQVLLAHESESPETDALLALLPVVDVPGAWILREGETTEVVACVGEGRLGGSEGPSASLEDMRVPILVRDQRRGTLGLVPRADRASWSAADVELLETAAAMVGAHWARVEARARLEAVIESKDRFVTSISHELRTPLTGVIGFAQVLQSRWHAFSPEEAREVIDLILAQSEDVAGLVEDLLVVGRADIGKLRLHPEFVDLRQQVELACGRDIDGRGLLFEGHGVAYADAARVRQIVRNLVSNAHRYGGERVRVRIAKDADRVHLEVRDDGGGVPQEAVERIFEPFESAHDTVTQPGSVGLGLWVARRLADLMGGSLEHRREHDETVFSLTLPVAVARPDMPYPAGTAGIPLGS
jgi:signal transduction histidine kinase